LLMLLLVYILHFFSKYMHHSCRILTIMLALIMMTNITQKAEKVKYAKEKQ